MPNETGRHAPRDVSRRNLFKQVGLAGAAAAISGTAPAVVTAAAEPAPAPRQSRKSKGWRRWKPSPPPKPTRSRRLSRARLSDWLHRKAHGARDQWTTGEMAGSDGRQTEPQPTVASGWLTNG
jgi:hypothetical protein